MPEKSNWAQTEEANCIQKGSLAAVIYFSDRSWSDVTVYGPRKILTAIETPKGEIVKRLPGIKRPAIIAGHDVNSDSGFLLL
jgi:hypothetical protein